MRAFSARRMRRNFAFVLSAQSFESQTGRMENEKEKEEKGGGEGGGGGGGKEVHR